MANRDGEATDNFTIDGFRGLILNRIADNIDNESSKTDTDREFSITSLSGLFDDVDIFSATGFHEIKPLGRRTLPDRGEWLRSGHRRCARAYVDRPAGPWPAGHRRRSAPPPCLKTNRETETKFAPLPGGGAA